MSFQRQLDVYTTATTSYDVLLTLEQRMCLLGSEVYLEHTQQVFVTLVNSFLPLVNVTRRNCALYFLETILILKRLRFKTIKPGSQIHAQS